MAEIGPLCTKDSALAPRKRKSPSRRNLGSQSCLPGSIYVAISVTFFLNGFRCEKTTFLVQAAELGRRCCTRDSLQDDIYAQRAIVEGQKCLQI